MPEMYFHVRWPDGREERCYSPSLVIGDFLQPGRSYPVADFVQRCEQALGEASARVQQKYGYFCSSAMDQLGRIRDAARPFEGSDGTVQVESFQPGAR
ncbi:MAG: MSMEG_0570 family nitrogen starvation response protein [Proteobacteria bacterium]|nr:MSMEG_0570 family nitrogen starvation response protein [Pseudomonadota bacterium]